MQKVKGSNPSWSRAFLCGAYSRGFPPVAPVSPFPSWVGLILQSVALTQALAKIWTWFQDAAHWLLAAPPR